MIPKQLENSNYFGNGAICLIYLILVHIIKFSVERI